MPRQTLRLALLCALLATGCGPADPASAPPPARPLTPTQLRHAYGLDRLQAQGLDGRGTKIAIVIPGVNPHAQTVLDRFSGESGLPRTRIEVINRGGKIPDPKDEVGNMAAFEAVIDLQIAHAAAPGAQLLYVQTRSDRISGIGDSMEAIGWLARNRRDVDVISMSWGAAEPAVLELAGGRKHFDRLRQPLVEADRQGISLLAATGDYGSGGHDPTGATRGRTVPWPASDPLVLAVGGSRLYLDAHGERTRPDGVWGSALWPTQTKRGAGAGTSMLFDRPAHQDHAAALLGPRRGVPDLVGNAADESAVEIHTTERGKPVMGHASGTSIAAPLVAGVVAIAAQRAGRPLGNVGPILHRYASRPQDAGLTDLTSGCNHTAERRGFCARTGYDVVSGMGALKDAPELVKALASYEGDNP